MRIIILNRSWWLKHENSFKSKNIAIRAATVQTEANLQNGIGRLFSNFFRWRLSENEAISVKFLWLWNSNRQLWFSVYRGRELLKLFLLNEDSRDHRCASARGSCKDCTIFNRYPEVFPATYLDGFIHIDCFFFSSSTNPQVDFTNTWWLPACKIYL